MKGLTGHTETSFNSLEVLGVCLIGRKGEVKAHSWGVNVERWKLFGVTLLTVEVIAKRAIFNQHIWAENLLSRLNVLTGKTLINLTLKYLTNVIEANV